MAEITLQETLSGHQNPIYIIEVDTEQHLLYSAGNDKGIVEWDLQTKKFKRILCAVPASVYSLKLIPGTDWIAAGMRNGELFIIERSTPKLVAKLKVDKDAIFNIQVLKNKNELIAIGEEGKAYVWHLDDFQLLYSFQVAKAVVRTIAVSADEQRLAFGDKNGYVHLYDAQDFTVITSARIHEMAVTSMRFHGEQLYTGGRDARMYKVGIPSMEVLQDVIPHFFTVYGICSIGDNLLTVSRDKTIKLWSQDFRLLKNVSRDKGIDSHHLSINTVTYDAELEILCTAGDDKLVKIWSIT